jgi:hypothetical protein
MGIEVYIKSEPSGEYTFGSISKEDLVEYGVLPDGDANGTIPTGEFDNLVHAYGLAVNLDTDLEMILKMDKLSEADKKIIIKNSEIEKFDYSNEYNDDDEPILKLEPGYYIQMSAPSKYSTEFELDVEEEDFDAFKLKLSLMSIALPCDDEYGEVDMTVLTGVEYNGVDYYDDMMDNMVDRGYDYRHTVIKVLDNGTYEEIFDGE